MTRPPSPEYGRLVRELLRHHEWMGASVATGFRMSDNKPRTWLPSATYDRVAVTCSARRHGGEPRRLPDRRDSHGAIAAVLVDHPAHAEDVFRCLDRAGRTIYVDVERKQEVDLYGVALRILTKATLAHIKPNDVTVHSLDVFLTHLWGSDLRELRCGIYGTGNLAFKIALQLAERNASVFVAGRSDSAVTRTVTAINAILPRYQDRPVQPWSPEERVNCLVSAVTARGVVGREWLSRLADGAHVLDLGIDNLDGGFISEALSTGVTVTRVDTRAAESQTVQPAPGFFEDIYGRAKVAGIDVVSGGFVGARGVVVVDNLSEPTMVVGVANGTGGLVPDLELSSAELERVAGVQRSISRD